jgi:menaquinone-dependent protoporphyrinogen oxidase
MRVLVTAATKYGATGEIADAVRDLLRQRGFETTCLPPERVDDMDDFDAVVLGSAVYAGHWLKSANEFVGRFGPMLSTRPVWLFSSGPIGDPPKPEEDPVDVAEILSATKARDHRVFAGRLVKKQLTFAEKAMVLAFRAPEGDFRDWTEIEQWVSAIADALGSES